MDELKNPLDAKSLKFMQRDAIEQITLQILPGMQPDGFKNPLCDSTIIAPNGSNVMWFFRLCTLQLKKLQRFFALREK